MTQSVVVQGESAWTLFSYAFRFIYGAPFFCGRLTFVFPSPPLPPFLTVGQCGNQIGCRFWDLALREHAAVNKVRSPAHSRGRVSARAQYGVQRWGRAFIGRRGALGRKLYRRL